jgi:hypothetical protein
MRGHSFSQRRDRQQSSREKSMTKVDVNITLNCPFKERHENDVDGSSGGARLSPARRSA